MNAPVRYKEIVEVSAVAKDFQEIAAEYAVTSPEMRSAADADLNAVKKLIKKVEGLQKEDAAPLKAEIDEIKARYKTPLDWLEQAKSALTSKILTFDREQAAIERERRIAAEVKANEARKALRDAGMADAAALVQAPAIVSAPPVAPSSGKRELWHAEVMSLDKLIQAVASGAVSSDYLLPNAVLLNKEAREQKDQFNVPGVVAVREETLVANRGEVF